MLPRLGQQAPSLCLVWRKVGAQEGGAGDGLAGGRQLVLWSLRASPRRSGDSPGRFQPRCMRAARS